METFTTDPCHHSELRPCFSLVHEAGFQGWLTAPAEFLLCIPPKGHSSKDILQVHPP
jgi:hypothetical protein